MSQSSVTVSIVPLRSLSAVRKFDLKQLYPCFSPVLAVKRIFRSLQVGQAFNKEVAMKIVKF